MNKILSVDEYIKQFDGTAKERLIIMRQIIKKTAPSAVESISYGMPAYKVNSKPLVYFAGYRNHTGFYAVPNAHKKFQKEFAKYKQGKGSVQFPHDQDLPTDLIKKVVKFRQQIVDS